LKLKSRFHNPKNIRKMQKIVSYIVALLCISSAFAQVDRSKLPEPGEPRPIEIGDYESFELKNGLKVFVVENNKLPRVAFRLALDLEPVLEKDKAGYVGMVGQLMERGTTSRTKEQLDEEIDFIGASISVGSSSAFASGLSKYSEKVLELMTDIIFNPTFPEEELEKIRTQTISGIAQSKDSPDAIAGNISRALVYGKDHPYGEISTEESVKNVTVEDIKKYHETYFKPNVAYLAVVGDITKKEAEKLVKKYFSSWKSGDVPMPTYQDPAIPQDRSVAIHNRSSSVQSVINVTYPVELEPYTQDAIEARVLNQILGGGGSARLFMNLREDKGYTYGAYSSLSPSELIGRFNASASVRNEVTDSAVVEFIYELERLRTEKVSDDELDLAKNSISGSFARSLESAQTVATFALNTAIYDLDKDYYSTYLQKVEAITADDLLETANKYIKPDAAYVTVVGKAAEIEEGLKQFGEISYFDTFGNPVDPAAAKLPDGVTASTVINDYIDAIGGKEKLAAVQTLKMEMAAEAMGQQLMITRQHKAPKKLNVTVSVGGQVMNEQRFDGANASMKQMGQSVPLTDEQKAAMGLEAYPFPEIYYDEMGVETKLVGIEEIDGNEAFVVEVTTKDGKTTSVYFDRESKFIIRESTTQQTPQGQTVTQNVDYGDYQEVNGIMLPHMMKIPLGPGFKAEAKMQKVEIDVDLDDAIFEVE
jgi:predicted Zn-dependent peptidase